MPVPCAVLNLMHPVIGIDIHNAFIPPVPPPGPPAPHLWLQIMGNLPGIGINTVKYSPNTFAFGFPPTARGTDLGPLVVHVGVNNPGSLFLIALGSGSVSEFGSFSVHIKDQTGSESPIAVALQIVVNPNLNCQGPVTPPLALPTGIVVAPSTVFAGMSIGDYVASMLNLATDMLVSFGLGKIHNLGSSAQFSRRFMGTALGMFGIGSPVGYSHGSLSIAGWIGKARDWALGDVASGIDNNFGAFGGRDSGVDTARGAVPNAVIDYFATPSTI